MSNPAHPAAPIPPAVPGFVVAREHASAIVHGTLLTGHIETTAATLYLPPGTSATALYPSIYLIGTLPPDDGSLASQRLAVAIDDLVTRGVIPPLVAIHLRKPSGDSVVDRAVRFVDSHLPTIPSRSARSVVGLGRHGLPALDLMRKQPNLFGVVECWNATPAPAELDRVLATLESGCARIFLSSDATAGSAIERTALAVADELHKRHRQYCLWRALGSNNLRSLPYLPEALGFALRSANAA